MADTSLTEAHQRILDLEESMQQLEQLAREDRGWDLMISNLNQDLSPEGRKRISDLCEVMAIANPLIKRGFMLRHSYIHGGGKTITVQSGDTDTDGVVNQVVQDLLDDPRNAASLRSEAAIEQSERWLYTHGAVVLLCDTDPTNGAVVVRQEDPDHIVDHITDPEDAKTIWYWKRQYRVRNIRADGTPGAYKTVTVWHPNIHYQPTGRDRLDRIGRHEVRWDQPLLVGTVNTPATAHWSWGIPDAYAAVPWARMSKEFLEAWYTLMRALSRYAWRTSGKGASAKRAAQAAARAGAPSENPTGAGAHAFMDAETTLEAVPKSGATIDASSALPIQQFVAAALDVPLTMLLGDPGTTGARAVAETLDQPMELAMGTRRRFWGELHQRLLQYAIDSAVIAPNGPLTGTITYQPGGRRTVTLPDGWSRTIEIAWPDYDSTPIDVQMKAIRDADGLDKLPAELIARLTLAALEVEDADEWIEQMREEGAFEPVPSMDMLRQATGLGTQADDTPPADGQRDAQDLKARFDALSVGIRAGVDPADAADRVGMNGIKFTSARPVSLRAANESNTDDPL